MTKILITGAQGLLGSNFIPEASKKFLVVGTYFENSNVAKYKNVIYHKMDIRDEKAVNKAVDEYMPDIIIHTASIGNVDICEKNKKDAYQTNILGTKHLALRAQKIKAKFIFFSTNAVFDGENAPYHEKSKPNPINYYGKTKYKGEKLVSDILSEQIILRLNTMYGWHKKGERENPMTWILKRLKNREKTFVVNDIFNNHLYVKSAVEVLLKVLRNWKTGEIYHIAGADCVSRYDFFQVVADLFGYQKNDLYPVDSSFFDKIAPRPKNTCFKLTKMQSNLKLEPLSIRDGIFDMKKEMGKFDEKIN